MQSRHTARARIPAHARAVALATRITLLFGFLATIVPPVLANPPVHLWSHRYGGSGGDMGREVATDPSGNVVVVGSFYGTVDFGGGNRTGTGTSSTFIAKYNPAGAHQWSLAFSATSFVIATTVAVDETGTVFVAGFFEGTANVGGLDLVSAGGRDLFVARYDATGQHLWSKRLGGTDWESNVSIGVDESANVVVTGDFYGTVNFGGGDLVSAGELGGSDVFLARYDSAGNHLWSQRFGADWSDSGLALAVLPGGDIWVTGYFQETVDFGGGGLVGAGSHDIFLAHYNMWGEHVWSQRFGSASTDDGTGIAIDGAGNVLLTGYFLGTLSFGGANLVGAGYTDVFLAKFTPSGVHRWSRSFGGMSNEYAYGIAAHADGDVLLTGTFAGQTGFGGEVFTNAGDTDGFAARYDSTGAHRWSFRWGGSYRDRGEGVAFDASGNSLLTGSFWYTVNVGGGELTSAGGDDILLAKYGATPSEARVSSVTDIGNDQGRWVKIRFARSGYDAPGSSKPITAYEIYRRDGPAPPAAPRARENRVAGWTFVGSAPAHHEATYGIDVPTIADSTETYGAYHSAFFVRAATSDLTVYFDSPPDSGCSIDNLAPGAPGSFALCAGVLSWDACREADLDHYTVYGAGAPGLRGAVALGTCVSPGLEVGAYAHAYYLVTASDRAGNESPPAVIATGAGRAPQPRVLSVDNIPNPFNPATRLRYTVPSRGAVTVTIHDARGACVAVLVHGTQQDAGEYSLTWDGRDGRGQRVSSGVYIARIEHNGVTRTRKMVLLK